MTTTEETMSTVYHVMLRRTDSRGIDLQNPNNIEFTTAREALDALAALPLCTSPFEEWVVTRTDRTGRAWQQRVIAEHRDVLEI